MGVARKKRERKYEKEGILLVLGLECTSAELGCLGTVYGTWGTGFLLLWLSRFSG